MALAYGRPADTADMRTISGVLRRYYAAAAAEDGTLACRLTNPAVGATAARDYGQELGPGQTLQDTRYLSGAGSCAGLLTRLFEHLHAQLSAPIRVTGVRVSGDYAYALIGSATLPASFVEVVREAGGWTIDGLLGRPVP